MSVGWTPTAYRLGEAPRRTGGGLRGLRGRGSVVAEAHHESICRATEGY